LILKTSQVLSIGGDSFFRTEIPQFSPLFWLFNDVQLLFSSLNIVNFCRFRRIKALYALPLVQQHYLSRSEGRFFLFF